MSAAEPLEQVPLPEPVLAIARALEQAGFETWCVGGALRDWRLAPRQALQYDVDLATAAQPDQVRKLFPRTVAVGAKYGTVGVLDPQGGLHEVTTFRKDVATDGRHAVVEYGVSIVEDLHRRDFTINAMAYHPLSHQWLDPEGGRQDLLDGVVRAVGDPASRFAEDYLRILRMVRFAARFGFRIDPPTFAAAQAAAPGLRRLSAERVRDEWFKGLAAARQVGQFVGLWSETGAASVWIPELREPYPLPHEVPLDRRDPVILTVALISKPAAVLRRLRASGAEIARAAAMEHGPLEPQAADPLSVRRWLSATGGAADDLMALTELRAGAPPPWRAVVEGIRARGEATSRGQLALSGDDLVALGVSPGPELGVLLHRLLETVLAQPDLNTRDRLLELVNTWR